MPDGRASIRGRIVDQGAAQAREIALAEIERDQAVQGVRRALAEAESTVDEIEEGLVAPVVEVRHAHGPAQRGAEFILAVDWGGALEKSARIELIVAQVIKSRAMKLVGARLRW